MNKTVIAMQNIDLKGNIIPHQWFNTIKKESGSVDYMAILVLSEIVYWYRPSYKFDESGRVIGLKQKFDGDVLQKSYDDLADKLGASKRQVREAVVRLEGLGLVSREFRNLVIRGTHLSNVLFIHLDVEGLKRVTFFGDSYDIDKSEVSHLNATPPTPKGDTYTKITTKTTTHNTNIKDIVATDVDDIPNNKKSTTSKSSYKYDEQDMVLSKLLFKYIKQLDPKAKEPNFESWSNTVRLMRERDNRTFDEIKDVIVWCQNDSFWQGNILSTNKLRQQFSKLVIQKNKRQGGYNNAQSNRRDPEDRSFNFFDD